MWRSLSFQVVVALEYLVVIHQYVIFSTTVHFVQRTLVQPEALADGGDGICSSVGL